MRWTDWVTAIVAAYGAVLSTSVLLLELATRRRMTKGRVLVKVAWGFHATSKGKVSEKMIEFSAVNDGPKPITLVSLMVAVKGGDRNAWIPCGELPATLAEGEGVMHLAPWDDLLDTIRTIGGDPPFRCRAVFRGNTGREYRKKFTVKA